jgi:16S rRNA (guanine966-N2)-methyltransferase
LTARLQIHGGELAGRRLRAPSGIRPTQGIVKEAIFNALAGRIAGARVMDLFAGSGALGLEALSRGADHATFVERDRRAAAILRQNLEATGCLPRSTVIAADAVKWAAGHPAEVRAAGVILLDPPYGEPAFAAALHVLDRDATGLVVAELSSRDALPALDRLRPVRDRRYGDARVVFLEV